MLRALLSRKSQSQIHAAFTNNASGEATEDMLTASVFSRLAYLDQNVLAAIFGSLAPDAFKDMGTLLDIRFWPSFALDGGRVEPDVVLNFECLTVWVEAKRWDGTSLQSKDQLFRQWRAMDIHLPPDRRRNQLAMGGHAWHESREHRVKGQEVAVATLATEEIQSIVACAWEDLARAIDGIESNIPSTSRLLQDIGSSLRFHGVYPTPVLDMASLEPSQITITPFEDWNPGDRLDDWPALTTDRLSMSAFPQLQ